MTGDTKFFLFAIALPFIGLVYCFGILAIMMSSTVIQNHPIVTGAGLVLLPLVIASSIWLTASAKAYSKSKR